MAVSEGERIYIKALVACVNDGGSIESCDIKATKIAKEAGWELDKGTASYVKVGSKAKFKSMTDIKGAK